MRIYIICLQIYILSVLFTFCWLKVFHIGLNINLRIVLKCTWISGLLKVHSLISPLRKFQLSQRHVCWTHRIIFSWWRHQTGTFSCYWHFVRGIHRSPVNSPQRPVTRSFGVLFDLHLKERWSKHSWCWWLETPSYPLWRHSNAYLAGVTKA